MVISISLCRGTFLRLEDPNITRLYFRKAFDILNVMGGRGGVAVQGFKMVFEVKCSGLGILQIRPKS